MTNNDLAAIFERIANMMEIKGELIFKTLAYRRAAESFRNLAEEASMLYHQGRLTEIPGIGKAINEKVGELLTTGKLDFLVRLEQEVPPTLMELLEVPDVGPKKVALFWKQAGITTLKELEAAARAGQLRTLPGLGERSEQRIIEGIEALKRRSKRMLLGNAWPIARGWLNWLRTQPGVEQAEAAGSLRRWRSTIGDLDLVIACRQPAPVMLAFTQHPDVVRVMGQGENKSSVELKDGLKIQLWSQPPERFGTLWQYASGSKDHNVRLRELAQKQNLSLSERCITRAGGTEILCLDEDAVYAALGLPWIAPELREDRGEMQAATERRLPQLIQLSDLNADLHMHSDWSDGTGTMLNMAETARARGLKLIAITDHSGGLGVAFGLSVERLRQQRIALRAVQAELGDSIRVLQGAEVEIHADGTLDYADDVLAELDVVVASLHSTLRQPRAVITERLLKVMLNPHVDIIGHPSGRLLPNREGADLDWDAVLTAALESGVALEINAHPSRLDLDEVYARRAAEMGIMITIDTDAHSPDGLDVAEYGVSVARRAWLEPQQVLNTWSVERILGWLSERKR